LELLGLDVAQGLVFHPLGGVGVQVALRDQLDLPGLTPAAAGRWA
jgi:hypothetical protein